MTNITRAFDGRRTRRLVTASLGFLVITAGMLSGCASAGSNTEQPADEGEIELRILNQSNGQKQALEELAAKYGEEHNITITVDSPGPADYVAKLQADAQANTMADLFSAVDAPVMAPFYKAGWAMNLKEELSGDWGNYFAPSLLEVTDFQEDNALGVEPGIYGVWYTLTSTGVFANPANTSFDPTDPPATMEDFIEELGTGGTDGKGKFSVAASLAPQLVQSYASNFMTDEDIEDTLSGKAPWTTDAWEKSFQLFADLHDANAVASGSIPGGTDDNPTVEKSFFNTQDLGAIFDFTDAVSVAQNSAPDFTDYSVIALPPAADGIFEPRPYGQGGKGMAVNAKGEHAEEALAFLKWLSAPEQQVYFAENSGLVPSSPEALEASLPDQLSGYVDSLVNFQVVRASMTNDVRDVIVRDAQSLVLGEITVEQVLSDVQAAQDTSK
jgi:raffinose/stachyose/melibiose transport system substrate-binding protein